MTIFSLLLLIFIFGMSIFYRHSLVLEEKGTPKINLKKFYISGFVLSIIGVILINIYDSYLQYKVWLFNPVTRGLVINFNANHYYFFKYIFFIFFGPYLISFIAAIAFIELAKYLNKKANERFFYKEEYYLGAIGIFLSSHPGWLFYLIGVVLVVLIGSIITRNRFSLYFVWLPVSIFVIIIQSILSSTNLWLQLKI